MTEQAPISLGATALQGHEQSGAGLSTRADVARFLRRVAPISLLVAVGVHGTLGGVESLALTAPVASQVPESVAAYSVGNAVGSSPASDWVGFPVPAADALALAARGALASNTATLDPWLPARFDVEEFGRKPARQLEREQANIIRFIASRYRVTLEATSEFVHHAYQAARDARIDPLLVLAVMSVESSFDPRAQSSAGAQGLMQVHTRVHVEKFLPFGGIRAAFDPVANIRVGSAILREYLQRDGSVEAALKSYVGAALLDNDGGYGAKVLNARDRIAAAAAGKPLPPEWVASAPRSDRPVMLRTAAVDASIQEGPAGPRPMAVPAVDAGPSPVPLAGSVNGSGADAPSGSPAAAAAGSGDI